MSRRIAHRPHYRSTQQLVLSTTPSARKSFFNARWTYRRQKPVYEQHTPGSSLSRIPLQYRLMQQIIVYPLALPAFSA